LYAEPFRLKGCDVEDFLKNVTIIKEAKHMEYFNEQEIEESCKVIGQPYSSDSPYLKFFRSIEAKLEHFVTEYVIKSFPDERLEICRRERINKQAGRGASHNKFTHYILRGCSPALKSLDKTLFIKFEIYLDDTPGFKTELDVDFASDQAKANEELTNYVRGIRKQTFLLFEDIATLSYDGLMQEIFEQTKQNIKLYSDAYNYYKSRPQTETNTIASTLSPTMSLNTILYGPPGTGKTYNTINKAVAIASPSFDVSTKTRDEIKTEYDRLIGLSRINFVTFHQSLGYEDFIEGIKPKTLKDQVVYEIEDGVFKAFCNKARFINGNFDDVIEKFKKDISEGDGQPPLKIKGHGTTFDITYRGTNVFYVQPLNSTKENPWYPVNIENIRKAFETDSYEKIYNPTYVREVISHLKKNYGLVKGNARPNSNKENYVFIIDEINRGNVSQIFGELITLIEADKREDQPEALKIQLPYSKELFSVPDNVFILGTMNTADRSVEALDTALRRRFSFEFMPPDSGKIEKDGKEITVQGLSLKTLLDTINERVNYLLDEDHQIGHAYFCSIEQDNAEQLRMVFKNKIIPLLREYFYNDHGKIRMVLGDRFVSKSPAKPKFAVRDEEDLMIEKSSYTIADIDNNFDIVAALTETLHGKG
jgi:hypothetical protein